MQGIPWGSKAVIASNLSKIFYNYITVECHQVTIFFFPTQGSFRSLPKLLPLTYLSGFLTSALLESLFNAQMLF